MSTYKINKKEPQLWDESPIINSNTLMYYIYNIYNVCIHNIYNIWMLEKGEGGSEGKRGIKAFTN